MRQRRHIVVATDLTAAAEPVAERTAAVARSMDADVRLLHVLPSMLPATVMETRRLATRRTLLDRARRLGRETGRCVSYSVAFGDTPRRITRESENLDAVLTVIGYRTASKRFRLPLGPIAERTLRLMRHAVLIVRNDDSRSGAEEYRRVLLATDDGTDRKTLAAYLHHIAPQARLHRFEPPGPSGCRQVSRATAAYVAAMRRAVDADLLVIGMPRDDTLNPFRFRRLLTPLVRAPECDTLIVPQDCAPAPPAAPPFRELIRSAS